MCLNPIDMFRYAAMRDLAQELGMSMGCDPDDAHQVIYSLAV